MNEETFKNSIVVPFLRSIGFDVADIQFENDFEIQLGRSRYRVGGAGSDSAGGRLDILCRQGERNLLVAELKAPHVPLTEADVGQAKSYASLLQPMAPYFLVTNGSDTRLHDTVSGQRCDRMDPGAINRIYRFDIGAELALRHDALSTFVGFSIENLRTFCRLQVNRTLHRYCADGAAPVATQLQSKYIPNLFVRRRSLADAFTRFLGSGFAVFPVVGGAGVGKTNLLCDLAKGAPHPALFYSGTHRFSPQ